ncbi:MAG: cysteine--tRNA ligase [Anaerorhabdus sp.]
MNTEIKLYNTKTLRTEIFNSLRKDEVSIYVCGPTVYNHAHIGNARPLVVFDTLRRLFEVVGYRVKFVSNYTDVDDRIIQQAKQEKISESEITEKYIQAYEEIRKQLNTLPLTSAPKVTETMTAIIEFIQDLQDQGFAYEVDGDVFFRVSKVEEYGKITHQKIEDLQVGARIEENSKKENPLDFALWKKAEDGLRWDSKWGQGRPGWHTECVVMINQEFNQPLIDIHGGGQDLKFPHHENEVAQCQALHHTDLANVWMHNGMINIDGTKMSKSLGNFTFAKDVLAQYDAALVRWFLLSVHYRMELNFTPEAFEVAGKELEKVKSALKQAWLHLSLYQVSIPVVEKERIQTFLSYLADDLNTPNGYMVLFDEVKGLNQALRQPEKDNRVIADSTSAIEKMLWVLGIEIKHLELSEAQRALYQRWTEAKERKAYDEADKLRLELQQEGILS